MERHSDQHLYSLEITGDKMEDRLSDACHLRNLRLLRVLYLDPSVMMVKDSLLNQIGMSNHLRFLRIGTEVKSLPSSFSNLWNLETLWIENERSTLFKHKYSGALFSDKLVVEFSFPVLWNFPLTSDSLSTIARLPNLEELFLSSTIMQKEEWNMGEEDTFENLKYLELYEVTLAKWEVGEESFPVLEKLVLWECHKLREIPPNFGDICSLKIIKLVESPQLEDSALAIKQYVEDIMGVEKLQILDLNNIPLSKTGFSPLFRCLETKFTRVVYNVFDEF
ncbi:hypothetical protein T459_34437 [Capsicum annuum]|uniref:Late blight resistance protein homolog R1A-3 n=1 Tax=Capsicum annuum TaxID=4072 RepID=A0A2G2XW46_CAPAN|nr:hypothetical protein T459_34437 [Capsicum annuum]